MNIQEYPLIFVFMTFCISRIMNAKKISKFEREVKSNGNTLLPHRFIFFFHQIFPINTQKDSVLFFFMPCQYFQNNQCKQKSESETEVKSNGNTLLPHRMFFFFHYIFLMNTHKDSLPFFFMPSQYFQNNECKKKKTRNSRGKSRAMETHFHPIIFFFSLDCSYEHLERFPTVFFHTLLVFVEY